MTVREQEALRDQFAAAALTGLLAYGPWPLVRCAEYATWAYHFADALLERRAQPTADAPAPSTAQTAPSA